MDIRKRFSILLFAFVLSLGACVNDKLSAEGGQQFPKVKVIHVKDGDSFVVLTSQHEKEEVRLIDAPELHQAFGRQAKQYLSKLIKGKFIVIDFEKKIGTNACWPKFIWMIYTSTKK